MRSNKESSKFCHSKGNIRFIDVARKKFCHYLLACTCAPLLFGSLAMASTPVRQDIAQVISVANVTRPSLKLGSKGNAVNELQAALRLLGFYNGPVNGEYDNATANSVAQFRQAAGLPADNSVDERVWQRLFPSEPIANNSSAGPSITPPRPPISPTPFPIPTQTVNPPASNQNIMSVVNPAPEPRPATPAPQNTQRSSTSTTVRTTNNNNTQSSSTSTTVRTTNNNTQRSSTSTSVRSSSSAPQPPSTANQRRPANRQPVSLPQFTRKPNIQYTSDGRPILRPGMRGEEVTFLQQRLRALGYLSTPANGNFGATTESAVKALQQRFGLESDGVVGGATWNVLLR
ncbi:peptidoglycan-binding domain-containing protein [Calothrix sp. NIES-3974]|uniref:peptidoglycan-binding domain-containing protein n=1 Tax=Calothrix sp. NIES-3974 TaxID=2005462 RepID=UPI000B5ECBD7|nr:peptidoglycan-binding domain-containing protein [Calothrix sp. NIES-3974]BAZ08113.1 peptidoglycan binding domain-containing protein [Calothrix sp. NIES-3974]